MVKKEMKETIGTPNTQNRNKYDLYVNLMLFNTNVFAYNSINQ